jgi:spore germination protein GerM
MMKKLSVNRSSIDKEHPLGGEGLILRQPITRSQFNTDYPLNP